MTIGIGTAMGGLSSATVSKWDLALTRSADRVAIIFRLTHSTCLELLDMYLLLWQSEDVNFGSFFQLFCAFMGL